MEQICPYEQCTGCSACVNICPKGAVTMIPQGPLGDIHPTVNKDLCIDCNLCVKICPSDNPVHKESPRHAYALISKDRSDLLSSSSGGASSLLSQMTISENGVVYGCVEEDYMHIGHRRIDSAAGLPSMKKSKYVQSDIGQVYKEVRKDLNEGRNVTFFGTPCQVAGLKSFLRKEYGNLLSVDLVCHGVPSQKLLRQDVEHLLGGNNISLEGVSVIFREKKSVLGLETGGETVFGLFPKDKGGKDIKTGRRGLYGEDFYMTAFLKGMIFRDSCYQCRYAMPQRVGDITIGDFWGIGETSVSGENGRSVVLVNTAKGEEAFSKISSMAYFEEREIKEAIEGNSQLSHPSAKPKYRDRFIARYEKDNETAREDYMACFRKKKHDSEVKSKILSKFPLLGKVDCLKKAILSKLGIRH